MKTFSGGPRLNAGALLFFSATAAFSQEEPSPVRLSVSGEIELTFAWRDAAINEASLWAPGGLAAGSPLRESDTFVLPDLAVRLDAEGESWKAALEAGNFPLEFDSFDTRLQNDRLGESRALDIDLRQAWVEFFDTVRFGLQPFRWDPTGRGHALFLDPTGAESPWGELPDATVPPFPASGTSTVPQTRRDGLHPVGLTARWEDWRAFALLSGEGGPLSGDESVCGLAFAPRWGPFRIGAIATLFAGGSVFGGHDQEIGTAGLSLGFEEGGLFVTAEGYLQRGRAGRAGTQRLKARGAAGRLTGRYADGFWIQASFVWVGGDERGDDDKEGRFFSYEDNDATLIVEGNEFGLDVDSNYRSAQVSTGFEAEVLGLRLQPRALAAIFAFNEAVPLPPDPPFAISGRADDLGTEVDVGLDVPWSARVTLTAGAAFLIGAEALEEFTARRLNRADLFTLGIRARF